MNLEDTHRIKSVYMIGIGGIGMSALARYFLSRGKKVSGYDRVSTPLTDDLAREGSEIHFTADLSYIRENFPDPKELIVIYTPAVPEDHLELQYFRKGGYRIVKRAEMLGVLSKDADSIAVAGTHGKTTITTLIAHLLKVAGIPCTAFLGGISKNYGTNAILSGEGVWMVLEADEFDRSFLNLFPRIAVVSSCDPDHLDVYGTREKMEEAYCRFIAQIRPGGKLVHHGGLTLRCLDSTSLARLTYGLEKPAMCCAENVRRKEGRYLFDAVIGERGIPDLELGIPGRINIENALAAISVGMLLELGEDTIREALSTFRGVKRRFDVQIFRDDLIYIDDYAHHPKELEACIRSVRDNYPGKRITGVFQPHLYTRTRDFADGFAESLSTLDELILLPIYPAREEPIEGVTPEMILDKVRQPNKILVGREQLLQVLGERNPQVLLTLGAGDIDQFVEPIVNLYSREKAI